MSLFSTPKAPKPDKAAQLAAIRQQNLADNQLTDALQRGLLFDTRNAFRMFGAQPASASGGGYGGGGGGYGGGWGGGGSGGNGGGGFR